MRRKKMSNKNYEWEGVDGDNEVSLFEYGFLLRNVEGKSDLQVVYSGGMACEPVQFFYSWFDFDEFLNGLKSGDEWYELSKLASYSGCTEEEYIENVSDSPILLLSNLISYYGTISVFGEECYQTGYTEAEIREKLKGEL